MTVREHHAAADALAHAAEGSRVLIVARHAHAASTVLDHIERLLPDALAADVRVSHANGLWSVEGALDIALRVQGDSVRGMSADVLLLDEMTTAKNQNTALPTIATSPTGYLAGW